MHHAIALMLLAATPPADARDDAEAVAVERCAAAANAHAGGGRVEAILDQGRDPAGWYVDGRLADERRFRCKAGEGGVSAIELIAPPATTPAPGG